MTDGESIILKG